MGLRRFRPFHLVVALLAAISTVVLAAPGAASAVVLSGFSVVPTDPTANSSAANSYSLSFTGPSATAAKCVLIRFESDNSTVGAPNTAGWQYQGGSGTDGSAVTLTTAGQTYVGSIAAYEGAIPSDGLHASFNEYIGGGTGADGMTFSFLDSTAYGGYAGSAGGGVGYATLTGVAVVMKTSYDSAAGSSNFVGIATSGTSGGALTYASTNTTVASLQGTHAYDISVVSGHVIVKLDGAQVLNTAVTLPNLVYPAFTGGTGGSTDTHSASSISISYNGGGPGGTSLGLPPGMAISSPTLTGSSALTPASWGSPIVFHDFVNWSNSSGQALSSGKIVINGITHNPIQAGSYYAQLITYSDTVCTVPIDTSLAAFAITGGIPTNFVIDPVLTFGVAGYNSGSCNGATLTATSSTATVIPLGHVSPLANSIAGQTLTVSTNAATGYTLNVSSTALPSDGHGHTIAASTGTNASPTTFSSAGTAAFGYTTDHALSGTSTRFQTNKWAGLTTSNAEVMYQTAPVSADVAHVCFQEGVSTATPAAIYSATVTYTAVPIY